MHKKLGNQRIMYLVIITIVLLMCACVPCFAMNQTQLTPYYELQWNPQITIRPQSQGGLKGTGTVMLPPRYVANVGDTLANSTVQYTAQYSYDDSMVSGDVFNLTMRGISGIEEYNNNVNTISSRFLFGNTTQFDRINQYNFLIIDDEIYIPKEQINSDAFEEMIREYKIYFGQNYNSNAEEVIIDINFKLGYIGAEVITDSLDNFSTAKPVFIEYDTYEYKRGGNGSFILFEHAINAMKYNLVQEESWRKANYIVIKDLVISGYVVTDNTISSNADGNRVNITITQPRKYEVNRNGDTYTYHLTNISDFDVFGQNIEVDNIVSLLNYDLLEWLEKSMDIIDTPIFGAVSIGDILWFIIGISCFIAFLKVFAGG